MPLGEDDTKEALALINQILELGVSKDLKEELEEYKLDIEEKEFYDSDLLYLRALHKRLAK